jgi:DedD protein
MDKVVVGQRRGFRVDHTRLALFFLGAVAVCAIFFSLGYVVGRGQTYEGTLIGASATGSSAGSESAIPQKARQDGILASSKDGSSLPGRGEVRKKDEGTDYQRDLEFYNAVKDQKVKEDFHPQAKKEFNQDARDPKAVPGLTAIPGGPSQAKIDPSGKLVSLQLAALKSAREADRLARRLRSKGYPVYMISPGAGHGDQLIRVQVGPYSSKEEAVKVRARLEKDGFKVITKR